MADSVCICIPQLLNCAVDAFRTMELSYWLCGQYLIFLFIWAINRNYNSFGVLMDILMLWVILVAEFMEWPGL